MACIYLQIRDEEGIKDKRYWLRDQTIEQFYTDCYKKEKEYNKKWPKESAKYHDPQKKDADLIREIRAIFKPEYDDRLKKGLIKRGENK